MPRKYIEKILGKGEPVDNSVVLRVLGSEQATKADLYEWAEGGLWMQWKNKNRTIYVQFGGPTVVQNKDGSYSIGPNTRCCLVLFVAENSTRGPRDVDMDYKFGPQRGHIHQSGRDVDIDYELGPQRGHIHRVVSPG